MSLLAIGGSLLSVLGVGLRLWEHKEKNKLYEKYTHLERKIREQESLPRDKMDAAYLDSLYFELRLLCTDFTKLAGQDAPHK